MKETIKIELTREEIIKLITAVSLVKNYSELLTKLLRLEMNMQYLELTKGVIA